MRPLVSLNARQTEAVQHDAGPVLVLAGAGSGKTRVLVHRVARLIEQGRARPHEILTVTFTKKAAGELVERSTGLVGPAAADIWVGTFHGIAARFLRRHAETLGYPANFSIFDRDDQTRLLKELVKDADIDESLYHHDRIRHFIERAKNEARGPEDSGGSEQAPELMRELYARYQARLTGLGAMDFGDLIFNLVRLFRRQPELLERYRARFKHIMVDEYQDTNHAQYLVVSMLAAAHGNICVVGDDDQSIYGWRGADIRNILEFERDFPGAKVVRLDQNYRSTTNIINAAAAVIANNVSRMGKDMWTDNDAGATVTVYTAADERDEARHIAGSLEALGAARGQAAVFYRTHAQSRAIEEELVRRQIRYVIVGGTRFYERQEIRDLFGYLKFLNNPADDMALARIINIPPRGIGKVTWQRLAGDAGDGTGGVWKLLSSGQLPAQCSRAARSRLETFAHSAGSWMAATDSGVAALLERVIEESGYIEYLLRRGGDDPESRVENVRELITVAQNFDATFDAREFEEEDAKLAPLAAFLEELSLAAEVDGYDTEAAVVTLMTAHNSKGLEFSHVFLSGMEEGLFPHARSTDEEGDKGIEEERRLCYVAMTRARAELTLTHAVTRHVFGNNERNLRSRFLEEIPDELTTCRRSDEIVRPTPSVFPATTPEEETAFVFDDPTACFKVGMRVAHPMFGAGVVAKSNGGGNDEKVVVKFDRVGLKKLVARYARLQIV